MRKLHRDLVRQPKGEFPIHTITITSTQSPRVVHCKVNHELPRGGALIPLVKQKGVQDTEIESEVEISRRQGYERPEHGWAGRAGIYVQLVQAPWSMCDDLRTKLDCLKSSSPLVAFP
jgi:hypothetical protein